MRKEIEDLKRQLAYAQKQPAYALSPDDESSSFTNIDKKKKRERKLLKKPWKKDTDNRKKEAKIFELCS